MDEHPLKRLGTRPKGRLPYISFESLMEDLLAFPLAWRSIMAKAPLSSGNTFQKSICVINGLLEAILS